MASLIRLRGRELWRVRAQDGGGTEQNGREKEREGEREMDPPGLQSKFSTALSAKKADSP